MSFSKEWDQAYRYYKQMNAWPWSDVVSYVIRYAYSTKKNFRVLELGCGSGANIPFFLSLGYKYYGIDGSSAIVNRLKRKFPRIKKNLVIADFTKEIPFNEKFDLILDRSALTHNKTQGIKQSLELVYEKMKSNTRYIGIDWISIEHSDYLQGTRVDRYTRTGYKKGQFTGLGVVHFSNKSHLLNLFKKFKILVLEHKMVTMKIPKKKKFAGWNFVAKRI
jgi:SAM-dependent methyltransferase